MRETEQIKSCIEKDVEELLDYIYEKEKIIEELEDKIAKLESCFLIEEDQLEKAKSDIKRGIPYEEVAKELLKEAKL